MAEDWIRAGIEQKAALYFEVAMTECGQTSGDLADFLSQGAAVGKEWPTAIRSEQDGGDPADDLFSCVVFGR